MLTHTSRTASTGNCARFAATPLTVGGTPASTWLDALNARPLPPLHLTGCTNLVVVAPHPDDETLGLGAIITQLAASDADVRVVSVSDGGAAQPGATLVDRARLETTRRHELRRAARVLRIPPPMSLGLPDGQLADHEDRLAEVLAGILKGAGPQTWCAATWRGDGHPDHEAVGRAAATACAHTGVPLLEYPVWMWHWASPTDSVVPWQRAHSVSASDWAFDRKRRAIGCFRSQLTPSDASTAPTLPAFVLRRLQTVGEVVFQ
jgi:LmbE family N-acetylglucosaminyl deacetylase